MLGKIFKKKKEDEFFMAIPEGGAAVEAPVEFAPTITEKTEGTEAIAAPVVTAAPAATPVSLDNSAIIAAALNSYAASATAASEAPGTFADKYLVNAGNAASRRRPGVNMTDFVGMAKNVKR